MHGFFDDPWIWTSLLDCTYADIHNAINDFRPVTDYERVLRERGASARSDTAPERI